MPLRPGSKAEVRRGRYKVAVDAEEGRRRREDNMVEIRKNRREESLQKKRCEGLQGNQQFAVPQDNSSAEKKSAVRDLRAQQKPHSMQARRLLLDPAIHEEFTRLKGCVLDCAEIMDVVQKKGSWYSFGDQRTQCL